MRRFSALLLLPCALLAVSCGGSDSTSPTQAVATTSVNMTGFKFAPAAIVVAPGATVTWTNSDNTAHNVSFDNAGITSIANFSTGARTSVMPTAAGTYTYRCTLHAGMNGSVKVQ